MARGAAVTVENNFTRGLITELTAMNFPENAVTSADNVVFSELGSVTRRPGVDFEDDYQIHPLPLDASGVSNGVFSEFAWNIYQNDEGLTLLVQQFGSVLWFFDASDSISSNKKGFTVDLETYRSAGVTAQEISEKFCQFTQGKGFLFVVHPLCQPIAIAYNVDTDSITVTRISVEVRDFERLDDNLDIDERPTTLTNVHKYNLYNQGWYITAPWRSTSAGPVTTSNILTGWDTSRADFPSNADIWWVFKDSLDTAVFAPASILGGGVESQNLGNTPAPSGHYIYNAWSIDRTDETGITGLPSQTSGSAKPSTIAFYAGRVFYGGIGADKYGDKIYFSQIIESEDQFGKCYQVNDPTSETSFDLLDTDGGVISIPSVAKIISLKVVGDALVILGTNGLYAVRGTDNGSFKATDYTVEFISSVGATSHTNVIDVDGNLMWWNFDALYALGKDQTGLSFSMSNASKQTIQSVIDSVPTANKPLVKGAYNRREQVVYWLFNDTEDGVYTYNRVLAFNVISRAFYTFTIDQTLAPRVAGILSLFGNRRVQALENVTASAGIVTTAAGNVQILADTSVPQSEVFVFTTAGTISGINPGLTYSGLTDLDHKDWETFGVGVDAPGHFVTGYRVKGDFLKRFQSNPVMMVLGWAEGSQIVLKGLWDYGVRESNPQDLYPLINPTDFVIKRCKVRGKGRSLQFRFDSSGSNHFEVFGWSTFDTGGQVP